MLNKSLLVLLTIQTILFSTNNITAAIAQNNTVSVSAPSNLPPYSYETSSNNYQGFSIDLIEQLLVPGVKYKTYNHLTFDTVYTPDVLSIVTQPKTPKGYIFIALPHTYNYYVFTRTNSTIESLAHLYDKKIIVKKNDLPYEVLYKNKTSHILTVGSYKEALSLLNSGINDCAIIPYHIGNHYIEKQNLNNLSYISTPFLTYKYGFAVKEDQPVLAQTISNKLKVLIENNQYQQLTEKWLPHKSNIVQNYKYKTPLILVVIFGGIIILFLIVANHLLKKEIQLSVYEYIKEVNAKGVYPLTIDKDHPIIDKILSNSPLWVLVYNKEGQILKISNELLTESFEQGQHSSSLTLEHIFNAVDLENITAHDSQIYSLDKQLFSEEICLSVQGNMFNKWMIKYPLRFSHQSEVVVFNVMMNPMVEGSLSLNKISPEQLFKAIINALPNIIFFKNKKGEYLGGNKAMFEFSGKSHNELVGRTDKELFNKEKAENYQKTDEIVLKGGVPWEGKNWDSTAAGEEVYHEVIKMPLKDRKNKIFGLVGISHDITNHYIYEKELAKAKDKAEESDRIKSSFLANMSHEIRTPMNSIIGFSDLLADPDLTYDQRIEIIDMIQSNGLNLIDLIDDIIDISKIEAGQIFFKYTDFNLNSSINDAFNYANNKKIQQNKEHLNISFQLGALEDDFHIHSDPFRIRQILKNLMNAAIKYTSADSLFIGYLTKENNLLFYISSEYNMNSYEQLEVLLSENKSDKLAFSEIEESSGISLIIAKNIIERMGGELWTEGMDVGKPGFYFSLPFKKSEQKSPQVTPTTYRETPDWSGKNILVAEDEETNYILLEGVLSKTKANIIRANNGKEAIEKFNPKTVDLILMDIRMPEVNGAEATRKILADYPETIIIAQTAYALPEDKEQYLSLGMKEVLAKPIDPGEMYYTCNKYLKKE